MRHPPAVVLLSLAVASPGAMGAIWYVDGSVETPGDGLSWAGAFRFLQDALYEPFLHQGDEIRVAAGTYLPDRFSGAPTGSGDLTEAFDLRSGVSVYGGFPPGGGSWAMRDPALWPTVLSGDVTGLAQDAYGGCGNTDGGSGDCFTATPGIGGCANGFCCAIVCDWVPYCCLSGWDQQCAFVAEDICQGNATVTAQGTGQGIRLDGFTISGGSAVGSSVYVDPYL